MFVFTHLVGVSDLITVDTFGLISIDTNDEKFGKGSVIIFQDLELKCRFDI